MRRLLVSVALVAAVILVASPSAEACKRKVRVSACAPVVVGRYCEGPVAVPVVVGDGYCGGPVVVAKPRLRTRVRVAVDVGGCGPAVQISTPIGYFSLGR